MILTMMTTNNYQGDSKLNRLLPILEQKGFYINDYRKIKENVYWVRSGKKEWALKCYQDQEKLEKQHLFFKKWKNAGLYAATPVPFRENIWMAVNEDGTWGLFEWLKGSHLRFNQKQDRTRASKLVHAFHSSVEGITGPLLLRNPLYIKWERRIEQFEATYEDFLFGGNRTLFNDIHYFSRKTLEDFKQLDWGRIEQDAWERKSWLHGDVAHHNFIRCQDGKIKLIDFDLLQMGPELYDDIQLGQRFLPYTNHSLTEITSHFHKTKWKTAWMKGVLVPSDLLREWLYVHRRYQRQKQKLAGHLDWLESSWKERKEFVEKVQHMLT
ncbi:Phosphotransferase enzyme family protein [Thalassobacillus cyri]|uniref:Phosphotransferase enzyme family protein n=2 Tax=Thalassobacillus cyri TaxID=571932 RepID=A0A1H4FBZ3_9BACI|nr:Phosphotransferase enzyme family protein [Thalassobacillus cyri]